MEAKLVKRLSDAKDKVRINGFRPGKVPLQHLRKVYGKSFMAEVVNEILTNSTRSIISERGEKAAMQPDVIDDRGREGSREDPRRRRRLRVPA